MKKIYSIICALCVMHCAFIQAQTECSTIAEVKALADGTECVYKGTATTTFYDGYNGVVMQDATGTILLQSSYLSEANATTVKAGMEITNVKGTFTVENSSYMTNIAVKKADIANIQVLNENATFAVNTIDFDVYMSNIEQYSGVPVKFENVNIRTVEGTSLYEIYSLTTDNKLTVSFTNAMGYVVPARATFSGLLSADWSGKIFRVSSAKDIIPFAYYTLNNLKVGISSVTTQEYELLDTFTVTNVVNQGAQKVVYIQEEAKRQNYGLRVVVSSSTEVKNGDRITGLVGTFEPYVKGENQKSATLTQSATKPVKVVASGAVSRVLSNYIYTLTDNKMQNAYLYDATLLSLSGGVVTKNSDNSYSYVVENENGQGQKSIAIKVANMDDMSEYEGKSCPVQGVLDVAATYPENALTLILRGPADFLESNVKFNTLAELIAAGEPAGSSMTYELKNPVLVTYKFEKGGGENSYTTYFFMVQDNTAGIVVSLGTKAMENIKIGDSITGLRGVFSNMRGMTTNILDVDEVLREEIKVQSSDNNIEPIEVTIAELLANKGKYSNRVVILRNVQNVQQENTNADGSIWYDYYFSQNGANMDYTLNADGKPYFTLYDYMDITGVVDDRIIGTTYSVWPLSQEHIVEREPNGCEYIDANARIYSVNQTIFIETNEGANISLYTLQGQCIYTTKAIDITTQISNIAERYVIVLVDNVAYKLIVK